MTGDGLTERKAAL